jgi:hypothetical protein
VVNEAWLSGLLNGSSHHDPKKYPKSPKELLGRSEPKPPMGAKQWQAFIFGVTGKVVRFPDGPPP